MNTLSKEFTLGMFFGEDPENYKKLRKQWSLMVNSPRKHRLTMAHHILYLILIGKNWQKAVTLPTNKNKVENHYKPHIDAVKESWENRWFNVDNFLSVFDGVVTKEMYQKAIAVTDLSVTKEAYKEIENVGK
jgi:hypothetical protein